MVGPGEPLPSLLRPAVLSVSKLLLHWVNQRLHWEQLQEHSLLYFCTAETHGQDTYL